MKQMRKTKIPGIPLLGKGCGMTTRKSNEDIQGKLRKTDSNAIQKNFEK
jgi:hypothetical protein